MLAEKLDEYRVQREQRLKDEPRARQTAGALVIGGLQKRLLSCIEAFARTLAVHRRSVVRMLEEAKEADEISAAVLADLGQLTMSIDFEGGVDEGVEAREDEGPDDDSDTGEEEQDLSEAALNERMERATAASTDASHVRKREALETELALLDEMREIAEASRYLADPRIEKMIEWVRANMWIRTAQGKADIPGWNDRRVIIFTEYEDTRRYVERCLREGIARSDKADRRIATYTGSTSRDRREEIKYAFNTEPSDDPLRILIATDAAREGLNLQRHCSDLFHFDLPWNPGRLDQRNGRIDRKLQPADEVFCRYFCFVQRPEDDVLRVLVRKADRIREELGSVAKVLEGRVAQHIADTGIRRDSLDAQKRFIQDAGEDARRKVAEDELEDARSRQDKLSQEVETLRGRLERSRRQIGLTAERFRQTLSMSLRLAGAPAISAVDPSSEPEPDVPRTFSFPATDDALSRDSGWTAALDTLRERRQRREPIGAWRRRAAPRPVVFEDSGRLGEKAVQLHLEHRVAQRLLSRFTAQGLIHHDLSKACLTVAPDAIPRVVLLGRLSVYGPGAARLHEEIVPVTARWVDPDRRAQPLAPFGRTGEQTTLASLQIALDDADRSTVPDPVQQRLSGSAKTDIEELRDHLERRAASLLDHARTRLEERAKAESRSMTDLLTQQRRRIAERANQDYRQLAFDLNPGEQRQLEADRRAWSRRLDEIESELESEPRRIAAAYAIEAHRVEPIGLVYLWPTSG